eukprot:Sspe_Gene.32243::Locus_15822_Transcript_2_2_Confidence_0.750_Length_3017::g.32243::m.32243
MAVGEVYTNKVLRGPCLCCSCNQMVFLVWFALFCIAIPFAGQFLGNTTLTFKAPEGTMSAEALDVLEHYFPSQVDATDYILFFEWDGTPQGEIQLYNPPMPESVFIDGIEYTHYGVHNFTALLYTKTYQDWCGIPATELQDLIDQGKNPADSCTRVSVTGFNGYYTLYTLDQRAAQLLVGSDNATTLLLISVKAPDGPEGKTMSNFTDWLKDVSGQHSWMLSGAGIKMLNVGVAAAVDDILEEVAINLLIVDCVSIPLGLLLLMVVLRNVRLMIPPLFTLVFSSIVSFGAMDIVRGSLKVNSIAVCVMMSLVVIMNILFALALLNRYREALLEGLHSHAAVVHMLHTGGVAVLISGCCMTLCCLTLAFVREEVLETTGRGLTCITFVCTLANLTLLPSFLVEGPQFFSQAVERTEIFVLFQEKRKTVALSSQLCGVATQGGTTKSGNERKSMTHAIADGVRATPLCRESIVPGYSDDVQKSLWYRIGVKTQTFPVNAGIIALCVMCIVPFAVCAFVVAKPVDGFDFYLPKDNYVETTYDRMGADYGYGLIYPYKMVVVPNNRTNMMFSDPVYSQMQEMLVRLEDNVPDFAAENVQAAFAYKGTMNYTASGQLTCIITLALNTTPPRESCVFESLLAASFANLTIEGSPLPIIRATALWALVEVKINPLSPRGRDLLAEMRGQLAQMGEEWGYTFHLAGVPANSWDSIQVAHDSLPGMVFIMMSSVGIVLFFLLGSVAAPFRVVATTSLTVAFALGWSALVYSEGALEWLHWWGVASQRETFWAAPIISIPLIAGISVLFDSFLSVNAFDFYHTYHLTSREAILAGMCSSNNPILLAGLLVVVTFGGLLFSTLPILNQVAFSVVFAALLDALLIRPILTPCIMSFLGKYNWWPCSDRVGLEETKPLLGVDPVMSAVSLRGRCSEAFSAQTGRSSLPPESPAAIPQHDHSEGDEHNPLRP